MSRKGIRNCRHKNTKMELREVKRERESYFTKAEWLPWIEDRLPPSPPPPTHSPRRCSDRMDFPSIFTTTPLHLPRASPPLHETPPPLIPSSFFLPFAKHIFHILPLHRAHPQQFPSPFSSHQIRICLPPLVFLNYLCWPRGI